MNLRDWMRGGRSQDDQLVVMEGLCAAVHAAHQRNTHYRTLSPSVIEVGADGTCRITDAALRGEPAPPTPTANREEAGVYGAPEVFEKSQFSKKADIYVVGLVLYEMLAGRHPLVVEVARGSFQSVPSAKVAALRDLRPDISADLADAVGGCLEKDPEWRPADLSYLTQLLPQMQGSQKGRGKASKPGKAPAPRSSPPPQPTRGDFTFAQRKPASAGSKLPLIAVAVVLLGGAVAAWFWLQRPAASGPTTEATPPPATPVPAVTSATPPPATPTPMAAVRTPTPSLAQATVAPTVVVAAAVTPIATAAPTVQTAAPATAPPVIRTPPPTEPPATAAPTTAQPAPPPILRNVAPPKVKRGGLQLLDLHGNQLRPNLQVRIFKGKNAVTGISVPRFKVVNDTLMQVALMIDAGTPTGSYSIAVLDLEGHLSNTVPFEITP